MAKGFKKGAGGANPLNFKVVGGTTAPANPKENTIWVNTDVAISSWVFSATQPASATNGMVWIYTVASSTVAFNALKKNGIEVYPVSAKQYVNGTFVDKTAKSYQGGEWKTLVQTLTLIPNTANYPSSAWKASGSSVRITIADDSATVNYSDASNTARTVYINIDVTQYTTMTLKGTCAVTSGSTSTMVFKAGLFSGDSLAVGFSTSLKNGESATIDNRYDISALSGTMAFKFYFQIPSSSSYNANFKMTDVIFS